MSEPRMAETLDREAREIFDAVRDPFGIMPSGQAARGWILRLEQILLTAEQRSEEAERRSERHRKESAKAQAVIRRMKERPDLDSMRQLAADYFAAPHKAAEEEK